MNVHYITSYIIIADYKTNLNKNYFPYEHKLDNLIKQSSTCYMIIILTYQPHAEVDCSASEADSLTETGAFSPPCNSHITCSYISKGEITKTVY